MGIKAVGKYKLVITLEQWIPYFDKLMGFAVFLPQSEKSVKKYGYKYGTASKYMIYNGPFVQKGRTGSNLSWKMVKNKYLANTNIRKAISLAVNRKGLVSSLGGNNVAANTLTPPGLTDVNGKDYTKLLSSSAESLYPSPTKKSEAVKYLNKGMKQLGVSEQASKFSFKILADDTDSGKKTAELLQSNIEATFDSKVSVTVQNLPFKTRLSRSTSGNFDLVISGWSADFADPISFLDLFTSTNSENNGKWKNATYDKLIADSKTTSSTSKRWSDLTKAENILLKDAGVTTARPRL